MEKSPLVWIVIPTWNRCADLLECLESVMQLSYPNRHIVVVDNASTDDTVTAVHQQFSQVHIIELPENSGAVGASNKGFEYALENNADYVLRIDSDTVLDPAYLSKLIETAEQNSNIGIVVGKILYYDNPERILSLGSMRRTWYFTTEDIGKGMLDSEYAEKLPFPIDYAYATGFLVSKSVLEKTQGFNPAYFVYFEEPDFCNHVHNLGYSILCIPTAKIWHKMGESKPSPWIAYQWNRGKMLFFRKNSANMFHRVALIIYAYSYAFFRAINKKPGLAIEGH